MRVFLALVLAGSVLAGCRNQTNATSDPIDFPLYDGSTIVVARSFMQTVDTSRLKADVGVFTAGSGTYAERQVIASTEASSEDVNAWLNGERADPPPGYAAVPIDGTLDEARAQARSYGIDFAVFTKTLGGKTGGLLIITMDPTILDARFGAAMGVIDRYRSLPAIVRDPVDAGLKQRFGMTGTQLLDPTAPLGAALSAYDAVKSTDQRAIVAIDARKR